MFIQFGVILIMSLVALSLIVYKFIVASRDPLYKIKQLEKTITEVYQKVISQALQNIQLNESDKKYLQYIQEREKVFISLKEKNRDAPLEEQVQIYRDWLEYLLRLDRPKLRSDSIRVPSLRTRHEISS